jgi:hypothetical protein
MIFPSFSGPLLQGYAQDGKRQRLGVAQRLLGPPIVTQIISDLQKRKSEII